MNRAWTRCALMGLLAMALAPAPAMAQADMPPSPFAAFQTILLPNGMRVWYAHLPGSELTRMAVVVPAGRDAEGAGAGQVAHLLEHVLLGDRAGRTEAELVRELALRGGSHGGYTTPSATVYPLGIPTTHAEYGVHWLYDVVAPRVFGDAQAERNRQPVAVEIGARQTSGPALLLQRFLRDPRLLPQAFWRREFGIDAAEERFPGDADLWRLGGADLRAFYEHWYTPPAMTLVVVSGVPAPVLLPSLVATFGSMPWRPPQLLPARAELRQQQSRSFVWHHRATSTAMVLRYRLEQPAPVEQLRLAFLEDMLRHRLMERLRRGDDKLVYSVTAASVIRGGGGFLAITADVAPGREAEVRTAIDAELRRLAAAATDTAAFYADRDILARRLRIDNAAPGALLAWATDRFAPVLPSGDMPDLGGYYATVGPDSIGALADRLFRSHNLALHVSRPLPVPLPMAGLLAFLPALAAVRLFRRFALQPADMSRIRYVVRLRPRFGAALVTAGFALAAAIVVARLAVAAAHIAYVSWIAPVDSFLVHAAVAATAVLVATLLLFHFVGLVPRKVLVFDDAVRLKSATFRSTILAAADIAGVRVGRPAPGVRRRASFLPLSGSGVTLDLADGTAFFLPVRHPGALVAAITPLVAAPHLPAIPAPAPDGTAPDHPSQPSTGASAGDLSAGDLSAGDLSAAAAPAAAPSRPST